MSTKQYQHEVLRTGAFSERQDIQDVYGLKSFVENVFGVGSSTNVRIVLPDGAVASKAATRVITLTDGSEIFEVVLD